jgi:hypothetical protein
MNKTLEVLNNIFKDDPVAIHCIMSIFIPCNTELSNNDNIEKFCSRIDKQRKLITTLNLINAILKANDLPLIDLNWIKNKDQPELLGFKERTKEDQKTIEEFILNTEVSLNEISIIFKKDDLNIFGKDIDGTEYEFMFNVVKDKLPKLRESISLYYLNFPESKAKFGICYTPYNFGDNYSELFNLDELVSFFTKDLSNVKEFLKYADINK